MAALHARSQTPTTPPESGPPKRAGPRSPSPALLCCRPLLSVPFPPINRPYFLITLIPRPSLLLRSLRPWPLRLELGRCRHPAAHAPASGVARLPYACPPNAPSPFIPQLSTSLCLSNRPLYSLTTHLQPYALCPASRGSSPGPACPWHPHRASPFS